MARYRFRTPGSKSELLTLSRVSSVELITPAQQFSKNFHAEHGPTHIYFL